MRRYSSTDPLPPPDPELSIPAYWPRPPQKLSSEAGFHRFLWDLHYQPVSGIKPEYPIAAVYENTAPASTSPWAMPGKYQVVLTANGKKYTRDLTITMDPRVKTPMAGLQQQFDLSHQVYEDILLLQPINEQVEHLRAQLKAQKAKSPSPADAAKLDAFSQKLDAFAGAEGRRRRGNQQAATLSSVRGSLMEMFSVLQDVDATPTDQVAQAIPVLHNSTQDDRAAVGGNPEDRSAATEIAAQHFSVASSARGGRRRALRHYHQPRRRVDRRRLTQSRRPALFADPGERVGRHSYSPATRSNHITIAFHSFSKSP